MLLLFYRQYATSKINPEANLTKAPAKSTWQQKIFEMAPIKAIFLDGGDVLFKKIFDIDERIAKFLHIDPFLYREIQNALIDSSPFLRKAWNNIDTLSKEVDYFLEFYRLLFKRLGIKPTQERVYFATITRVKRSYRLAKRAKTTLKYLSQKYQLNLLSNCLVSRKYFELEDFGLKKYFTHIFLSRELKIDKPDPRIFTIALKRSKQKPQTSAFVDNKIENLQTARKLGFKKVVYVNASKPPQDGFIWAKNINDLKKIF